MTTVSAGNVKDINKIAHTSKATIGLKQTDLTILQYIDYKYFGLDLNSRIYTNPFISLNTAIGLSIIVIRFSMLLEKINITYLNLL